MSERFPQEALLRDGRRVLLRLFSENDTAPLYDFFHRLPEDVRRFAWDRIDNRALVESWGRELDYAKVLPILATDGNRVVADATLHRREGSRCGWSAASSGSSTPNGAASASAPC